MGCCKDGLVHLHMCDRVNDAGNRWVVLVAGVRGGGDWCWSKWSSLLGVGVISDGGWEQPVSIKYLLLHASARSWSAAKMDFICLYLQNFQTDQSVVICNHSTSILFKY